MTGALWLALIVIIFTHLHVPLSGDQALFLYGAKAMQAGGVLYKDFWDPKQPGIYLFYLSAGRLFGFNVLGLHILEALWMAATAFLALDLSRRAIRGRIVRAILPLAAIGSYFLSADSWHMTQPDGLVALPIALGAWALAGHLPRGPVSRWRLFGVGIAAGLAGTFLVSMVLVPIAMALVAACSGWHRNGQKRALPDLRGLAAMVAGLLVVVGTIGVWAAANGGLRQLIWTTFFYPFELFDEKMRDPSTIAVASIWFGASTIYWWIPAAFGCIVTVRRERNRNIKALPGLLAICWLVVGTACMLLQYHASWSFHFNQMFVPVGILAAIGIDELVVLHGRGPLPQAVKFAVIVTVAGSLLFLVKAAHGTHRLLNAPSRADIHDESARMATSDAGSNDTIFVFGNPLTLLASGLRQAVPPNGWAMEMMVAHQWAEFFSQLRSAHPKYVYVEPFYQRLLSETHPEITRWIGSEYRNTSVDTQGGAWWVSNSISGAAASLRGQPTRCGSGPCVPL